MYREEYNTIEVTTQRSLLQEHRPDDAYESTPESRLADEVLRERDWLISPFLDRYSEWGRETGRAAGTDDFVATHDVLTLGVLWRCYGKRAEALPPPMAWTLIALQRAGRRTSWLRRKLTALRTALLPLLLGPRYEDEIATGIASRYALGALLRWLQASGMYREETRRLRPLIAFLRSRDRHERDWYLAQLSAFTVRFGLLAQNLLTGREAGGLSSETGGVDGDQRPERNPALVKCRRVEGYLDVLGKEFDRRR